MLATPAEDLEFLGTALSNFLCGLFYSSYSAGVFDLGGLLTSQTLQFEKSSGIAVIRQVVES
eukprot:2158284-Amphidinium_carterae.2